MVINRVTEPYLFDDRDLRARSADAQTEQSVPRNEKFYYSYLMDFADAMVPVALCKFKDDCCGGSSGAARRPRLLRKVLRCPAEVDGYGYGAGEQCADKS